MTNPIRLKLTLLILICIKSTISAQESNSSAFASNLDLLMDGQIDSLELDKNDFIRIVQFNNEDWEGFNQHELENTKNGKISLDRFQ